MSYKFNFQHKKTTECIMSYYIKNRGATDQIIEEKCSIAFQADDGASFSVESDGTNLSISYDDDILSLDGDKENAEKFLETAKKHLKVSAGGGVEKDERASIREPNFWARITATTFPKKDDFYQPRGAAILHFIELLFNKLEKNSKLSSDDRRKIEVIAEKLNASFAPSQPKGSSSLLQNSLLTSKGEESQESFSSSNIGLH